MHPPTDTRPADPEALPICGVADYCEVCPDFLRAIRNPVRALERLLAGPEPPCIAVQNVAQFRNAATRPQILNGLGMTVEHAAGEVRQLEDFFEVVSENAASYATWKTLLTTYRVTGAEVHDARLAAVMIASGISRIVTFNGQDFKRFAGSKRFTRIRSHRDTRQAVRGLMMATQTISTPSGWIDFEQGNCRCPVNSTLCNVASGCRAIVRSRLFAIGRL